MVARSAVFVGAGTLPVRAAEVWLARGHRVVAVVSQEGPLAAFAAAHGIPAIDGGDDLGRALLPFTFDHLFSVASPWVLGRDLLARARLGAVNYHDALLPRYAGTYATSWAILNGERTHGVTWHAMAERVDAGDVLVSSELAIAPDERAVTLNARCWEAGARAFEVLVSRLDAGTLAPAPQDPRARTFFARFRRPPAAAVLSFSRSAEELSALVRALDFGPYPNALGRAKIALSTGDGFRFVAVTRAEISPRSTATPPGTVLEASEDRLVVGTATAPIVLSGLRWLDGLPALPISTAAPLPELDAATAIALETLDRETAPNEDFWIDALERATAHPWPLPPAPTAPACEVELEGTQGLSEAALVAAYAVLLARTASADEAPGAEITLGLATPAMPAACESVFATTAPLRLGLEDEGRPRTFAALEAQAREALQEAEEQGTFARDLVTRIPSLEGTTFNPKTRVTTAARSAEADATDTETRKDRALIGRAEAQEEPSAPSRPKRTAPHKTSEKGTLVLELGPRALSAGSGVAPKETIAALARAITALAQAGTHHPATPIDALPLIDDEDRADLLRDGEPSPSPIAPAKSKPPGPWAQIAAQATQRPEAIAVTGPEGAWSYAELFTETQKIAAHLTERGAGPGVLVGLLGDRGRHVVASVLAVWATGATYAPLDAALPPAALESQKSRAGVTLLLDLRGPKPEILGRAGAPRAEGFAYVIHTSGSTGTPKGVAVEPAALALHLAAVAGRYGVGPGDRVLGLASAAFDLAIEEVAAPLAAGATLVVAPGREAPAFSTLEAMLATEAVTVLSVSTAYLHAWARALSPGATLPASLRRVIVGTERADPTAFRAFRRVLGPRAVLTHAYGPTEAVITATAEDLLPEGDASEVAVGRPLAGRRVRVLAPDGALVPRGVIGEVHLGGDALAAGYLDDPERTAERFITDPHREGARLYRTGDLGWQSPSGALQIGGRVDDQLKWRGARIELGEIEAALTAHAGVREAAAIVVGEGSTATLVAWVAGAPLDLDALAARLEAHLASRAVPDVLARLDALPRAGASGKIDRRALARHPLPHDARRRRTSAAGATSRAPADALETKLQAAFARALDRPRVGLGEDFFALGGTSLTALGLFADLGLDLSLSTLLSAPTVERLAAHLRGQTRSTALPSVLVPLQPAGARPPLFLVHGIGGNVVLYAALIRHLDPDQPLFALQPVGLDGNEKPDRRIEAMAARYLEAIRAVAPSGPYRLGGFSLGGVIAFEMAQQLRAAGESIGWLGLFDTNPSSGAATIPPPTTLERKAHQLVERTARRLRDVRALGALTYARRWAASLPPRLAESLEPTLPDVPRELARRKLPPNLEAVWAANAEAEAAYERRPYPGRVVLFYGESSHFDVLEDLRLTWSDFCEEGLEVHLVPGSHEAMWREPDVRVLAAKLQRSLREA